MSKFILYLYQLQIHYTDQERICQSAEAGALAIQYLGLLFHCTKKYLGKNRPVSVDLNALYPGWNYGPNNMGQDASPWCADTVGAASVL